MRPQTMVVEAATALNQKPDQRRAQRQQLNQPAVVSVLETAIPALHGEIRNLSEGGAQLHLDQPLKYTSLVAVDYNDNRLLGEVVYCQQEQDGWLVGIRIEHTLVGLTALAAVMRNPW